MDTDQKLQIVKSSLRPERLERDIPPMGIFYLALWIGLIGVCVAFWRAVVSLVA
jgi:hypothetical protein